MEGLKLLLVVTIMVVLLWRRVPLVWVMLASATVLALCYQTGLVDLSKMIWRGTIHPTTIELIAILFLIMVLECLLRQYGYLERMLTSLKGFFRDRRVVMALLPVYIGLMPSAGGALFSAPLVGEAAAGAKISAEEKSFVNYYYRHLWEYFLPLHPGVLLASRISGLSLPTLIGSLAPYGLLIIFLGLPALLRLPAVRDQSHQSTGGYRPPARDLLLSISPLIVVVGLVLMRVEVWVAVGIVITALMAYHRFPLLKSWRVLLGAIATKTLLMVWGIMVFKQVLMDTKAIEELPSLLGHLPVPEFAVFGLFSFLVGLFTGLFPAAVGIVFPIVAAAVGQISLSLAVFIFITGFVGYMITPMHICLVLTVDFFKADIRKVLKRVAAPEAVLVTAAVIGYLVFK